MDSEISVFNTFLGKFKVVTQENKLVESVFVSEVSELQVNPHHFELVSQFRAYFEGKHRKFDLEISLKGTAFQKEVWKEVANVSYGSIMTYGQLARRLGASANPRNVGQANGQNRLAVIIPCHRIVGEDVKLTGYAWGIERKRKLLELEGALKQGTLF